MLSLIFRLIRTLNSESEPAQISLAFCFAMVAGFTPLASPHNILVLFLVLIIRVNLTAFILGTVFLGGVAYLMDPLFHRIGLYLLTMDALEPLWTALYNTTPFRLIGFNNTILMGSLAVSLVLFFPLFIASNLVIRSYREHIMGWVRKSRIVGVFRATRLYRAYRAYTGLGGGA